MSHIRAIKLYVHLRSEPTNVHTGKIKFDLCNLIICFYFISKKVKQSRYGCTGFWLGNLRERDHWGDPDVDGILSWIFRKCEGVVGTGWSWLRIGTGDGRLWVR